MADLVKRGLIIVRVAASLLLGAATAYSLERFVAQPIRCSRAAMAAEADLDRADTQPGYVARRIAQDVRTRMVGCECVWPKNVQTFDDVARASSLLGDEGGAIAAYERALTVSRRPSIYFALGMARLRTQDRTGAIDDFARACAFDPSLLEQISYDEIRHETELRLR